MSARHVGYVPGQGLPLASPLGPTQEQLSTQVSAEFAGLREPNTSRTSRSEVASPAALGRVGSVQLQRLERHLSERDREVLSRVAEHSFLTTLQVQAFCFTDHATDASAARTTRRVLGRLERDGLLRALDRQVGGVRAGSAARVWHLAPAGSRLVYGEARRRANHPSLRFLAHRLAVADVHLLLLAHRRIEAIEDVRVDVEPAAWRRYQGPGGEPRWLQPDLFTELMAGDFADRFFVEVDLGTESLPTLVRKCDQYERYRRSGIEQARHGAFPVVVWLLPTPERALQLQAAIRRSGRLNPAMFRCATPGDLVQVLAGGEA